MKKDSLQEPFKFVAIYRARETEGYWCDIEEFRRGEDQFLLCHIGFKKFTPAVMKQFLREWECFRRCVTAPLFAVAETEDSKWVRFVSRIGFRPLQEVICKNGERRTLFMNNKVPDVLSRPILTDRQ